MSDPIALLAAICEQEPPQITGFADTDDRAADVALLEKLGLLVKTENRQALMCTECNEAHEAAVEFCGPGAYRFYCPTTGYHAVTSDHLKVYTVNLSALAAGISRVAGITKPASPHALPVPTLLQIATVRFGPYLCDLYLGRLLGDHHKLAVALEAMGQHSAKAPAIAISTTPRPLIPDRLPGRVAVVPLADAIRINADRIELVDASFLTALRGHSTAQRSGGIGFIPSLGYRTAEYNNQEYAFTDKQALVVEALHNAHRTGSRRLHQSELQCTADTPQRVGQLFKSHPAYGTLIKQDGNGHYWLEL